MPLGFNRYWEMKTVRGSFDPSAVGGGGRKKLLLRI